MIVVSLACLFEALSVVYCLHYLYGTKPYLEKYALCFLMCDIVWMNFVHFSKVNQAWSMMIYPIIVLYCGIRFGFKLKTLVINNVLYMVILSGIEATIMLGFSIVFNIQKMSTMQNLIVNIVVFGVVSIGLRYANLKQLSETFQSNDKLIVASLGTVILVASLFLLSFKWNKSFEIFYYVLLGISIILIIVSVIDIGKHKIKMREAEAELKLHRLYEASFQNLIDDICAKQHEFDNHINAIYSQHRLCKSYDELVEAQRKYCGEIILENHFNKILSKGNPVIIGFLYSKLSEMGKKGITVTYQINIGDLKCEIPVYKMVELLGNLINNAMEAVQEEKGEIYVSIVEESDMIVIEISNESEVIDEKKIKEFFRKGYSEKGKNRGYGLYNVGKICEEYGIAINCKNEKRENENWIVFKLVINKSR